MTFYCSGGFATGAGGKKSMQERTKFGGMANASYDPCYHRRCDTVEDIDQKSLIENAKVIGGVVDNLISQANLRKYVETVSPSEREEMSQQLLDYDLLHMSQ